MNNKLIAPEFEVLTSMPKDFFNKNVNEKFIKLVMESIFTDGEWIKGNANNEEPDYFFNNIPFEFTLASDKCTNSNKNNFINKVRKGQYTSENVEKDAIYYINEQIKNKAEKKYSVENVHLCILCMLDRFDWISDMYGSCTHFLTGFSREQYFEKIKNNYIDSNRFRNIFILFPDTIANWWVWDIRSNKKVNLQVTPAMMESQKYPYFIDKRLYLKLVENKLLKNLFGITNKNR